jgi:hypothetical protein
MGIDPNTWKVVSPTGNEADVAQFNTPELIERRARASLAIRSPEAYAKTVTKDAAQIQREEAAIFGILFPP